MSYKHGDIVLVYFPDSNLQTVKKRPAVVVQANNLKTGLEQIIVSMITSNLARNGHPSRILIDIACDVGKETGLLSNSVIMTDNIATVRMSEIYQKIGVYSEYNKLKKAIKHTFGI